MHGWACLNVAQIDVERYVCLVLASSGDFSYSSVGCTAPCWHELRSLRTIWLTRKKLLEHSTRAKCIAWISFFFFRTHPCALANLMNKKGKESTALDILSSLPAPQNDSCPPWITWFIISQPNYCWIVPGCIFHKAPGSQYALHMCVCFGVWLWPNFLKEDIRHGWWQTCTFLAGCCFCVPHFLLAQSSGRGAKQREMVGGDVCGDGRHTKCAHSGRAQWAQCR